MLPAERQLAIYQGDSFLLPLRLRLREIDGTPGDYIDLTDAEAKAEIREIDGDNLLAEFTCEILDQTDLDLIGSVTLSLTSLQTTELVAGRSRWDFQITFPDEFVRTYLAGKVIVSGEVTHG